MSSRLSVSDLLMERERKCIQWEQMFLCQGDLCISVSLCLWQSGKFFGSFVAYPHTPCKQLTALYCGYVLVQWLSIGSLRSRACEEQRFGPVQQDLFPDREQE